MKVTGLGGGHGLAATLRAALGYAEEVSAVVTVADDGGSSGQLTREIGIPPPGDIRNCLVATAPASPLAQAYQHRFGAGPLTGHTLGNLLIAALTEMTGDFGEAVSRAGRLIGSRGEVYPATNALVRLRAQVKAGVVEGQVAVAQTEERIQAVFLEPADPPVYPGAQRAVMEADQVILGPGSLFTSLIATLLVPGIREAIARTEAQKVFVCNSRMQKGETQGLDVAAHVEALLAHAGPDSVDVVLVQSPPLPGDGVAFDRDSLGYLGIRVVEADVVSPSGVHDPERLAAVLGSLDGGP